MIPLKTQEKLKKNWGDKAEALACNVECRIYDPARPKSEWLIYAQNPDDEEELMVIECFMGEVECKRMPLISFATFFNSYGERMVLDKDFRPREAAVMFQKKREERGIYEGIG